MRRRLGEWLRRFADRIDDDGAPRVMGYSFTFENGAGIRFRDDNRGCPLAYLSPEDYDRAFVEADAPTRRINWKTMRYADG